MQQVQEEERPGIAAGVPPGLSTSPADSQADRPAPLKMTFMKGGLERKVV